MRPTIAMKLQSRPYVASVSNVNFVEKNRYNSRDIEFLLGVTFLARPVVFTIREESLHYM